MFCPYCNKLNSSDNVFCLGCGALLKDYHVPSKNLDYGLNKDDFLNQAGDKFSECSDEFGDILNSFTASMDSYSNELDCSVNDFSSSNITMDQHRDNIVNIFNKVSVLFENTIIESQQAVFDILNYLDILFGFKEYIRDFPKLKGSYDEFVASFEGLLNSAKSAKVALLSVTFPDFNREFEDSKNILESRIDRFIIFFESFIRELKLIKDEHFNNKHMVSNSNHNNFCIYCGAKLDDNQNFCTQCGKEVYKEEPQTIKLSSKYEDKISEIEQEYIDKQDKAVQLVEKIFGPSNLTYEKFYSSIRQSNKLFENELEITKNMIELDDDNNAIVEKEIDNKIKTLQTFVDKMDDLINELIIHLGSDKDDNEDINNLFEDMDDLINSVKDY